MRRGLVLFVAVALAGLTACGLPLPEGVRSAQDVRADQPETTGLEVLQAGPQPGATAAQLVSGFLAAQSSPTDDYAVAREFLAPGTEWDTGTQVLLYRAGNQRVDAEQSEPPTTVSVRLEIVGTLSEQGAFSLPAVKGEMREDGPYTVVRTPSGELRLSAVPQGVRLPDTDRPGSFVARDVYFFGRADAGASARLVADRLFQLRVRPPEAALVDALLSGPSSRLSQSGERNDRPGAVETAIPAGTQLLGLSVEENVVTVDLSGEVAGLDPLGRQRLSAQFVWTLAPEFRGVRLLVEGRPLAVPGAPAVQSRTDWAQYDPSGLGPEVPLLLVSGRRLASLGGGLPRSEATNGTLDVDRVALQPGSRRLALLTDGGEQPSVVRTGPLSGPFDQVLTKRALTSLSWGSGERGLFVLEDGSAPLVWLVPQDGSPPRTVGYTPPSGAGKLSALSVSRDGARIAMVFGEALERHLYVGRLEPSATELEVKRLGPVAPQLANVAGVAWESGTSLVLLASDRVSGEGPPLVLPFRAAVDGSGVAGLSDTGLPRPGAVSITAAPGAPDHPIVISVRTAAAGAQLYRESGAGFDLIRDGAAAVYPG